MGLETRFLRKVFAQEREIHEQTGFLKSTHGARNPVSTKSFRTGTRNTRTNRVSEVTVRPLIHPPFPI
jgi:hypothetical protein